eukprot:SAG11_NODE_6987_length_1214_cov_0.947085_3_plen_126_part_01
MLLPLAVARIHTSQQGKGQLTAAADAGARSARQLLAAAQREGEKVATAAAAGDDSSVPLIAAGEFEGRLLRMLQKWEALQKRSGAEQHWLVWAAQYAAGLGFVFPEAEEVDAAAIPFDAEEVDAAA